MAASTSLQKDKRLGAALTRGKGSDKISGQGASSTHVACDNMRTRESKPSSLKISLRIRQREAHSVLREFRSDHRRPASESGGRRGLDDRGDLTVRG